MPKCQIIKFIYYLYFVSTICNFICYNEIDVFIKGKIMEYLETLNNRKSLILKIFLAFVVLFFVMTLFTGCASTDKTQTGGATSKEITYTYNAENDTTRIDFLLYFENNTIYNMIKEDCTFRLYKDNQFVKNVKFYWVFGVKANNNGTRNSYIVVDGNIDKLELDSWTATFDNLWNTYQTWWLIIIIAPIILALVYLFIILFKDLELSDIFESVGTWIGTAVILGLSFISPFVSGSANWFPLIICLIGVVATVLLCLLMSGIKALLDMNNLNPFEKMSEKIEHKKEEKYYKKLTALVSECGTNKSALQQIGKDDLVEYCDKIGIVASGTKKSDLINAIVAYAGGDSSVLQKSSKKSNDSNKKVKTSSITFNDIAGLDKAKDAFREKVILPFEHPELYKKFGKKAGGGILLYGLPGTGKTMFAEAASNEVDALFLPVKCSDIKSKWYGESEQKVKEIFTKARKAQRAVIFFDEFEAIGSKRTESADNGNNDLVPEILAEMQGVGTSANDSTIVVIAATNKPWSIDSAFLRPGRFDEKIYIPLPDKKARIKLFEIKLKGIPTEELDFEELAKLTNGFNGADITEFCERLKMQAINQSIKTGEEHLITMEDALNVSKELKSSVSNEDIGRLKQFEEE